ncbi:MAG: SDR family oxidoreductase [Halieaceae bacterium]|jgi:NAD(P)-dependent dehydrogenase (short-subunit alcohol dehydrogenase family)|nr:SDR family oxidoreductase [Halieaceae bacterium]
MSKKVAFITGASRGIGAESAVALAGIGYNVAITARSLNEGENHLHGDSNAPLPGSLSATAAAVEAVGGEALCLPADILQVQSLIAAANQTLDHFGGIDLLFNNAVYQGLGNQTNLLDTTPEQLQAIYQGNIFTPLALVQTVVPGMLERRSGTIINMISHTAYNDPPAPADQGGWGFAYPSSKAAFARMPGALRVEHPDSGLRAYNLEPGMVVTEVMKALGIDELIKKRFRPVSAAAIGAVVAWLADNEPPKEWGPDVVLHGPAIARDLNLLKTPSMLGATS